MVRFSMPMFEIGNILYANRFFDISYVFDAASLIVYPPLIVPST